LLFVENRISELALNLPYEMDLDTTELVMLQQAIVLCESEMTAERALELKKNLDLIERFVEDQKEVLQSLLVGINAGKKVVGQYGTIQSRTASRFVYRKA
jgi:hypothetical protein